MEKVAYVTFAALMFYKGNFNGACLLWLCFEVSRMRSVIEVRTVFERNVKGGNYEWN